MSFEIKVDNKKDSNTSSKKEDLSDKKQKDESVCNKKRCKCKCHKKDSKKKKKDKKSSFANKFHRKKKKDKKDKRAKKTKEEKIQKKHDKKIAKTDKLQAQAAKSNEARAKSEEKIKEIEEKDKNLHDVIDEHVDEYKDKGIDASRSEKAFIVASPALHWLVDNKTKVKKMVKEPKKTIGDVLPWKLKAILRLFSMMSPIEKVKAVAFLAKIASRFA